MGGDLTRGIPPSRELARVKVRALVYWQIGPNPVPWHVVPSRQAAPIVQQICPLWPQRHTGPKLESVQSEPSLHTRPGQQTCPLPPHRHNGPKLVSVQSDPSEHARPGQQACPLCPQRQTGPYIDVITHGEPSVHVVPPQHESPFRPHWQVPLTHSAKRPHIVPPQQGCP